MKYMLLIHHGDAATPNDEEAWGQLSQDEQKRIYAEWQEIGQADGVQPGMRLAEPTTATTVRVENGETLTTDGARRRCSPRSSWARSPPPSPGSCRSRPWPTSYRSGR